MLFSKTLLFEQDEYLSRLKATRQRMRETDIEALMVTDPSNINYLSGYDAWSFYVTQCLIVSLDDPMPTWIGRAMDSPAARITTFLDEAHIIAYDDSYVQAADRNPMTFIAEVITAMGLNHARIGLELDAYFTSPRMYQALVASLSEAQLVDASLLVNWLRTIKSPAELALMDQAARLAERSMQAAYDTIDVGVRGCDVAAAIYHAQLKGTSDFGGSYLSSIAFLPTGSRSATPHLSWSDAPYQPGQITPIELAGCRQRYSVALSRTVFLGRPPAVITDLALIIIEGLAAALEAIRPGTTCEAVEATWRKTVSRHGLHKASRLGYSIGLSYPPTTGDRTMSLRPGDTTVLRAGMTLHLIPGIWREEWGMVISESVCVTATGCRQFCEFPQELYVKD